jgi:hypothetical protein
MGLIRDADEHRYGAGVIMKSAWLALLTGSPAANHRPRTAFAAQTQTTDRQIANQNPLFSIRLVAYFCVTVSSVRRFWARPCSVSFDAIGRSCP